MASHIDDADVLRSGATVIGARAPGGDGALDARARSCVASPSAMSVSSIEGVAEVLMTRAWSLGAGPADKSP